MIGRDSLRLRLTIGYALCAFAILSTIGLIVAVAIFTIDLRAQSQAFEKTVGIVRDEVSREPAGQPLAVTLRRVTAMASARGIGVVAIPPAVFRNDSGAPYGLIDIGSFYRLSPEMIPVGNGGIFVVPAERERKADGAAFEAFVGVVTLLAAFAAWPIARLGTTRTLRPLLVVTSELERFASGDFSPRRLRLSETSEYRRLAMAYNGAAEKVTHAFFERRSVEERIRQFVADAGHELRTPLTVLTGYVDVLGREGREDALVRRDAFASVLTEIARMRTLVESLVKLARLDGALERNRAMLDFTAIAREAVRSLSVVATAPVAFEAPANVRIAGEAADAREAIENLLANALKYGAGTRIAMTIVVERGWAILRVRDGGPGIAETDRERIFERFYRGKNRAGATGSGLGLAIASRAAERLRGRLTLEDARAGSTTFAFAVPTLRGSDASESSEAEANPRAR